MAASQESNKVKTWAPYQWEILTAPWFEGPLGPNRAQVDTIEKARRIGGSEVAAMRCVLFMLGRELHPDGTVTQQKPMDGIVVSKDLATGKDFITKVTKNLADMAAAGDKECAGAQPWATKIILPSTGRTIRALAATGTTIRGWDGFVTLDEFAHHRDPENVWGAVMPICMPNWGNPRGTPLIIISSPWDADGLPFKIFNDDDFKYRRHRIDIYRAISQNFPITVAEAKAQCPIPELFATEYECKWAHGGGSFFPLVKLQACIRSDGQTKNNSTDEGPEVIETPGLPDRWWSYPCFYGIDVGGGVGRDFTAIVQWRIIDNEYWIVGIKAFNHLGIIEQMDQAVAWIKQYPGEIKVDRGIQGLPWMQTLQNRLSQTKCQVSGAGMAPVDQEGMVKRMRQLLDNDNLRIYSGTAAGGDFEGHKALMLELSMMKAVLTGARLRIETPRDQLKGHCDRAWGAMIGLNSQMAKGMMGGAGGGSYGYSPKPYIATNPDSEPIGFG